MLKLKLTSSFVALTVSSALFAGTMGPVSEARHTLFVSGEGAYTWNSIDDTVVHGVTIDNSTNGWGGRIAAGAIHYSVDNLSYTAEMGWGYYGQTKFESDAFRINTRTSMYGLDLLVGGDYRMDNFDLFLKVGGMIENAKLHKVQNNALLVTPLLTSADTGVSDTTRTYSSVVPEIKVGGIYNLNDQWGVSLAYMYVFGNDVSLNIDPKFTSADTTSNNITARSVPVALSTLSLGLQYKFS